MPETLVVAIAGTTVRTVACAASLHTAGITIPWVLTPEPKPVGRTQQLTPNPVDSWALEHSVPRIHVRGKIDSEAQSAVEQLTKPDILLVVDFGYIVPDWLIAWPRTAPTNIHPSDLPRWRGSSPAQFALLFGDTQSAICLIELVPELDAGPVIHRIPFPIQPNWTANEYYEHAFTEISAVLPEVLQAYAAGRIPAVAQPSSSPTPTARRLSKEDAYIDWETLCAALRGCEAEPESKLLKLACAAHPTPAVLIEHAVRAFSNWPVVWTHVPTTAGPKRMQILSSTVTQGKLELGMVKVEGKKATPWHQVQQTLPY